MAIQIEEIADYIVKFLLGDRNLVFCKKISYGDDGLSEIVIVPSGFFDDYYMAPESIPQLPLKEYNGVPILFGMPETREINGRVFIYMDFIASSFFLMSRYEECIFKENVDKYGRYTGKGSFAYKAGVLSRPLIDEYGVILKSILKAKGYCIKESEGFSHIYLSHDVDNIWTYDSFASCIRAVGGRFLRHDVQKLAPIKAFLDYKSYDPIYTFPWILNKDAELRDGSKTTPVDTIYFLMGCSQKTSIDNNYINRLSRTKDLVRFLKKHNSMLQYHVSYAASDSSDLMRMEKKKVEEITESNVTISRNHFLASKSPSCFEKLIDIGIQEDFSMGYADIVGFRCGTCRSVQWIDPIKCELTNLVLHPLTVMECTLDREQYMDIKEESEAFKIIRNMLDITYKYCGEVNLLWHNTSFSDLAKTYHRNLYTKTISYLGDMICEQKS